MGCCEWGKWNKVDVVERKNTRVIPLWTIKSLLLLLLLLRTLYGLLLPLYLTASNSPGNDCSFVGNQGLQV